MLSIIKLKTLDFIYYNSSCIGPLAAPVLLGGNPQKPEGRPLTSRSLLAKAVKEEIQFPRK